MTATMNLPKGVIFNAYPDSIGQNLADIVAMLKRHEFEDVFSLFYILPTIFNSDLDRGFSIIDYDLNDELVSREDLEQLHELNVMFKFDLVLNHLSVSSPQFQDLLKKEMNPNTGISLLTGINSGMHMATCVKMVISYLMKST